MTAVPPIGLVGRGIAALGAVLLGASLFLDISEGGGFSYWDAYRRTDVVVLVAAIAAILLLLVSLTALEVACLFLVGAVGGFGLGTFSFAFVEESFDRGLGAWLSNVGSVALLVGAAVALVPALRGSGAGEYAFLTAEPAPEPAPVAATVQAGWYADPSGQARLRYWDGQAWTEQTQP